MDGLLPLLETPKCKQATEVDIPDLVNMAREFHSHSLWRDTPFDEEQVTRMADVLVRIGGVFVNSSGGFIAGTITPLHFSPSVGIATELAWWAPNGGGRELREAFEDWARERGARMIQFSALADENFDEVHDNMTRSGFALAELQYVKAL